MRFLAAFLLACAAAWGLYSNSADHAFHFDSIHSVQENPALRDLGQIPRYFTDPTTFTVRRSNINYRPVLQVTYALNHRLAGLAMPGWHAVQVLLHVLAVLGLFRVTRELVEHHVGEELPAGARRAAPWVAGLLMLVHPVNAGVVNYLAGRSGLLVTALLFHALARQLRALREVGGPRVSRGAVVLYGLALFTKITALAFLGVLLLLEVHARARREGHARSFPGDLRAALDRETLRRLAPYLAVTAVYLGARGAAMASVGHFVEAMAGETRTPLAYLSTQVVVWWRYVGNWFLPTALVADPIGYPLYPHPLHPRVLLAVAGWVLVVRALLRAWRTRPYLLLLAAAAFALLSPTSSFVPLDEPLNEVRPYGPVALLSLVWILPTLGWVARAGARTRGAAAVVFVVAVGALAGGTRVRNRAFLTREAYWEDVLAKMPSYRAYGNLGAVYAARRELARARPLLERSLELRPVNSSARLNLAQLLLLQGDLAGARHHLDLACAHSREAFNPEAFRIRGEFLLSRGEWEAALADLEVARSRAIEGYRVDRGRALALVRLGRVEEAARVTLGLIARDEEKAKADLAAIAGPLVASEAGLPLARRFFEVLDAGAPGRRWILQNLRNLAAARGQAAEVRRLDERLGRLR